MSSSCPIGNRLASMFSLCSADRIWHSTRYSMVLTMDISDSTAARSFSIRLGSKRASSTSHKASRARGSIRVDPIGNPAMDGCAGASVGQHA